jgi:hypothetical protein
VRERGGEKERERDGERERKKSFFANCEFFVFEIF